MSALDDVTAAIIAARKQLAADLTAAIADIKANSGAPTPAQIQALQDVATSLQGDDAAVKAADPGPAAS